jgi:alkylation response protein AidB-like acyl-CoA dehydrogenase
MGEMISILHCRSLADAYSMEYPMERYLRESFLSFYAGGVAEIQKNIISRYLQVEK